MGIWILNQAFAEVKSREREHEKKKRERVHKVVVAYHERLEAEKRELTADM